MQRAVPSPVRAACAATGVPLTDNALGASSFAVVTGHDLAAHDWRALAALPSVVVLMAGKNLAALADLLLAHGKPPHTPVSWPCAARCGGLFGQDATRRTAPVCPCARWRAWNPLYHPHPADQSWFVSHAHKLAKV